MWIVRLALSRPYTFIVMALAVVLLAPVALQRTPTDIFPDINIPVISLVWKYNGFEPQEMERRITANVERGLSTLVNDIEHIESQSLPSVAVIHIYFQPNANIQTALAQTAAISQTFLGFLPPGTTPPLVIIYSASTVPVLQLGLTSDTLSEQELFDYGTPSFACNWRRFREPRRLSPMAENSGISRWTSIRRRCRPRGFRRWISSTR